MVNSSDVSLVSSTVAREELEKIPAQHREPHLARHSLLGQLSSGLTTWIYPTTSVAITDPVYQALTELLPNRPDAEHVFQAHSSNATTFLTTDEKTILRSRDRIRDISGVNVMLPSESIAQQ